MLCVWRRTALVNWTRWICPTASKSCTTWTDSDCPHRNRHLPDVRSTTPRPRPWRSTAFSAELGEFAEVLEAYDRTSTCPSVRATELVIKGCQDLGWIPRIIRLEMARQLHFYRLANELRASLHLPSLPPHRDHDDEAVESKVAAVVAEHLPLHCTTHRPCSPKQNRAWLPTLWRTEPLFWPSCSRACLDVLEQRHWTRTVLNFPVGQGTCRCRQAGRRQGHLPRRRTSSLRHHGR